LPAVCMTPSPNRVQCTCGREKPHETRFVCSRLKHLYLQMTPI